MTSVVYLEAFQIEASGISPNFGAALDDMDIKPIPGRESKGCAQAGRTCAENHYRWRFQFKRRSRARISEHAGCSEKYPLEYFVPQDPGN